MSVDLQQKALGFTKTANQALAVAAKLVNEKRASEKAAAEIVPALVTKLKQAGLISESDQKQASVELSNHKMALDVLSNVLDLYREAEGRAKTASEKVASTMGTAQPVEDKKVTKQSNYVGRRMGEGERSDADVAFMSILLPGYNQRS